MSPRTARTSDIRASRALRSARQPSPPRSRRCCWSAWSTPARSRLRRSPARSLHGALSSPMAPRPHRPEGHWPVRSAHPSGSSRWSRSLAIVVVDHRHAQGLAPRRQRPLAQRARTGRASGSATTAGSRPRSAAVDGHDAGRAVPAALRVRSAGQPRRAPELPALRPQRLVALRAARPGDVQRVAVAQGADDPLAGGQVRALWDYYNQYAYGVVVGFNLPSGIHYSHRKRQWVADHRADTRRGGGIFLHVNGTGSTAGCVSMTRVADAVVGPLAPTGRACPARHGTVQLRRHPLTPTARRPGANL